MPGRGTGGFPGGAGASAEPTVAAGLLPRVSSTGFSYIPTQDRNMGAFAGGENTVGRSTLIQPSHAHRGWSAHRIDAGLTDISRQKPHAEISANATESTLPVAGIAADQSWCRWSRIAVERPARKSALDGAQSPVTRLLPSSRKERVGQAPVRERRRPHTPASPNPFPNTGPDRPTRPIRALDIPPNARQDPRPTPQGHATMIIRMSGHPQPRTRLFEA